MLPLETTPESITPQIAGFVHRVASGQQAQYVTVQPAAGAVAHYCTDNVAQYVSQHGGEAVLGWCIWERPTLLLHAEFHMIWRSPEGELIDITPKPDGEVRILFVPDPRLVWQGKRIRCHYAALRFWREISEFITANEKLKGMIQPGPNSIDAAQYFSALMELGRATKALERKYYRARNGKKVNP